MSVSVTLKDNPSFLLMGSKEVSVNYVLQMLKMHSSLCKKKKLTKLKI